MRPLADLANQTDPLVVRRRLLEALDEVIDMCVTRTRTTKDSREYRDPDHSGAIKGIELAARITGAIGIDPLVLVRYNDTSEDLVAKATEKLRAQELRVAPAVAMLSMHAKQGVLRRKSPPPKKSK